MPIRPFESWNYGLFLRLHSEFWAYATYMDVWTGEEKERIKKHDLAHLGIFHVKLGKLCADVLIDGSGIVVYRVLSIHTKGGVTLSGLEDMQEFLLR